MYWLVVHSFVKAVVEGLFAVSYGFCCSDLGSRSMVWQSFTEAVLYSCHYYVHQAWRGLCVQSCVCMNMHACVFVHLSGANLLYFYTTICYEPLKSGYRWITTCFCYLRRHLNCTDLAEICTPNRSTIFTLIYYFGLKCNAIRWLLIINTCTWCTYILSKM